MAFTTEQQARIAELQASVNTDKVCVDKLKSMGVVPGSTASLSMVQGTKLMMAVVEEWMSLLAQPGEPDAAEMQVLGALLYPLSNLSGYRQHLEKNVKFFAPAAKGGSGLATAFVD